MNCFEQFVRRRSFAPEVATRKVENCSEAHEKVYSCVKIWFVMSSVDLLRIVSAMSNRDGE